MWLPKPMLLGPYQLSQRLGSCLICVSLWCWCRMDDVGGSSCPLLGLPDPCLLRVLHFLADEPRSMFSAARAHNRLHNAAVMATNSILVPVEQQQLDTSLLPYLLHHGQHLSSITVGCSTCCKNKLAYSADNHCYEHPRLDHLPILSNLTTLICRSMLVQLQPGSGQQGMITAALPLKQLMLEDCRLVDVDNSKDDKKDKEEAELALAAALSALPHLESLSINDLSTRTGVVSFPVTVLRNLQQLTALLISATLPLASGKAVYMPPLKASTRLIKLRLFNHVWHQD